MSRRRLAPPSQRVRWNHRLAARAGVRSEQLVRGGAGGPLVRELEPGGEQDEDQRAQHEEQRGEEDLDVRELEGDQGVAVADAAGLHRHEDSKGDEAHD
eukprot:CAMPEP_0194665970 /NCGR_PEP_ID=MMETSP0295-20121207/2432_1 /TAXON_ID=39354 /ORGANISM="Heterosigma akashiwo, Strain CCMP2393" /LENGTH=98 /DNA_ID=CAMNT_0039548121 /DNA_START=519 /DNA_END=812 /DNA_ORIENTATION=-